MRVHKGDNVIVTAGKDRGKSGKILQVMPKEGKVVVQGVNMLKRHQRPRKQGEKGQIFSKEAPLDSSNVMVVCPTCTKPTRVGSSLKGDGKTRVCKKCGATL